ncbi:hypothetical protein D3273_06315 [Lichenibacterium minor]|jgi:hypothetical protein|uniref:Uncharacterized protein n=1 Tax=Lichenibacterium minor TaxID=2316528 RepID=A0A4Q2UBR1_9HYPH|nr:hypothetical protein [Lichenibacterium minor]RYC32701.1 hypothetical protein D3273_06315 [Lichenibacterium minor]
MPTCEKTRRHFTEAAREAAALARQRKRDHKTQFPEEHQLVMVVVRAADRPRGFAWQIRRFGHMEPVAQSADTFVDPADAGRSGQAVLDGMRGRLAAAE